ncbi:glutamate synthase large subunit [Alishewanella longhuensis]
MYSDLKQLKQAEEKHHKHQIFSLNFDPAKQSLQDAVTTLCANIVEAVREQQVVLVILTDRRIAQGLIPISCGYGSGRCTTSTGECSATLSILILIIETAAARDPHHFAVLIGLGATAIYPFLAYETVEQLVEKGNIPLTARQAVFKLPQRY